MVDKSFNKQTTMPDLISGEPSPPLPTSIGPYKIDSLFNQGGMSLIYLGMHADTKKPIAIKVLSPSYVNHSESVERFLKEARIIALTNHPNIVKLYGQGEWEKGLYIAMEFIHGISLRQFILQHSLSMRRALEIILQVAYALLHLHSHGVIHRDLKPENILIDEEGEVKVIDFGIAQLHDDKKLPKTSEDSRFIGTPNYMSPEQKENPDTVSFTSDIYSLGIILYELVTGKLSYGMINLSLLPKGLKKIISKALAVSISERYQDISSFIHDISQYLNSGEMEKERPGSDQIKEIYETLQKASLTLSPLTPPSWPQVDIGLAKYRGIHQIGLYYDFFHMPNNTYLILMAASASSQVDSAAYIGAVCGMVRTLLNDNNPSALANFKPLEFLNNLNHLICSALPEQTVAMSLVFLNPLQDLLTYVSCGFDALLHLPQGNSEPRKLSSQNPLLGVNPHTEFSETSDNWNEGDLLILHSLIASSESTPAEPLPFEVLLNEAISENALISAQRQAEAILKKASFSTYFSALRYPKALITVQRIT